MNVTKLDIPKVLVGNKCDIEKDKHIVTEEELNKIAQENHAEYFLTSAKTGHNIEEMMNHIMKKTYEYKFG